MTPATADPFETVYYPVEKLAQRRVCFAGRLIRVGSDTAITDRLASLASANAIASADRRINCMREHGFI